MTRFARSNVTAGLAAVLGSFASAQSVLVGPGWSFETNQTNAQLSCVRAAGDVNGDGFGDVIASAPLFDTAQVDAGRLWVFLGSNTGLASTPSTSSSGPDQAHAKFGAQIAAAGDVDGDGYDDVLVSAPASSNPELGEGAVFLHRGGPGGLASIASWSFEGNVAGASVSSVGSAGDLNHDGLADVLVGVVDCSGTYSFSFTGPYLASKGLVPGSRVCAQFYSRDNGFAPPNNIGLTSAIEFLVCP